MAAAAIFNEQLEVRQKNTKYSREAAELILGRFWHCGCTGPVYPDNSVAKQKEPTPPDSDQLHEQQKS